MQFSRQSLSFLSRSLTALSIASGATSIDLLLQDFDDDKCESIIN